MAEYAGAQLGTSRQFQTRSLPRDSAIVTGVARPEFLSGGVPVLLLTRLTLTDSQVTASEAIELGKCTAGVVDVVVFAFTALASIQVDLEMGSDRENWSCFSSALFTRIGFARFRFRGIPARYLRLYFRASGSPGGIAILTTTLSGAAN